MTRRALGRGRRLMVIGALACVAGMLPAWWSITRTNAESVTGNGLEGAGVVVFLAAMALLAVITLPFATREGDSALDRPAIYVLLGGMGIAAFLFRIFEISRFDDLGLPMDAPGLWLTGAGLLLIVWGVADILTERPSAF